MSLPHIPGFTVRPAQLEDAVSWASYACLPEVKEHTSSTATTVEDVKARFSAHLPAGPTQPFDSFLFCQGVKPS